MVIGIVLVAPPAVPLASLSYALPWRRAPRRGTHPSSTRRRCRSCRLPGRCCRRSWPPAGRAVPPDAVPLSGGRGPGRVPRLPHDGGQTVRGAGRAGLATPAVTVGTPVFRTAGA